MNWKNMFACFSVPVICLVLFFHQGVLSQDVRNVVGYINESVDLQSTADPSWTLSQIIWSIYGNDTYIANFRNNKLNVDSHDLFQKRLKLNTDTGDLTITNILPRDALQYTVDVTDSQTNQNKISYVQLSVLEPLKKPQIELRHRYLDSNNCVILLSCSSNNINISLIWQPEDGFNELVLTDRHNDSGELLLLTSFTPNRPVTFSCLAVNGSHRVSSSTSVNCTGSTGSPQIRTNERLIGGVIGGLVGGVFGSVIGFLIACFMRSRSQKGRDTHPVNNTPPHEEHPLPEI